MNGNRGSLYEALEDPDDIGDELPDLDALPDRFDDEEYDIPTELPDELPGLIPQVEDNTPTTHTYGVIINFPSPKEIKRRRKACDEAQAFLDNVATWMRENPLKIDLVDWTTLDSPELPPGCTANSHLWKIIQDILTSHGWFSNIKNGRKLSIKVKLSD